MKTILVATDFSHAARNAVNYAMDMALAIGANLYVLHVYELPFNYIDMPAATIIDEIQEDAEKNMLQLQQELTAAAKGKLNVETAVKEGNFFETLVATCAHTHPYVVVIGSLGKTAAERFIYGAHAAYVMQHLEWPVIAVPLRASFSNIKKIGLACDLHDVLGTVPVEEIKVLVSDFNAALHVLNTGSRDHFNPEVSSQSVLLQKMLGKEITPVFHFITDNNTDEGIIHFAETNHIDLLVVLPRHRSLIDKLMHSSHTKHLVLHSHVPVAAFHHHFIKSGEAV